MRYFFKIVLIPCLFIISELANATHVLPVFAEFWYTNTKENEFDACGKSSYIYTNKVTGDAGTAAGLVLQKVPFHPNCTWDNPKFYTDIPGTRPDDFIGNDDDWNIISKNQNLPHEQFWKRACVDSSGKIYDDKGAVIIPSYVCPHNSKFSYGDEDGGGYGCTTNPGTCTADIVGRDLNIPLLEQSGHIGIATGIIILPITETVIEVLHANPVIQKNPMSSFKFKTNYWGAKYNLKSVTDLTESQAQSILNITSNQFSCDEVTYTYGWNWHSCQYDSILRKYTAVFRCDSFVYNAYKQGANIQILNYAPLVDPEDIFNAFITCRSNEGSKCSSGMRQIFGKNIFYRYGKISLLQENDIKEVFAKPALDVHLADKLTYYYTAQDASIIRSEKLNFLWDLALQYKFNPVKFDYVMGCLDYLNPIELTEQMISVFGQLPIENQFVLIRILANMTSNDAIATYKKYNMQSVANINIPKIKSFFINLLFNENNPKLLARVIFTYPHVFPERQAKTDIEQAMQRKNVDKSKLIKILSVSPAFYTQQLNMIFSSADLQQAYCKSLLDFVKQGGVKREKIFNKALAYFFKDADYYPLKIGFDNSKLLESSRKILMYYIDSQKTEQIGTCSLDMDLYYDWLAAKAAVMTTNRQAKNRWLANYIVTAGDPYSQALLISRATKEVMSLLSNAQMQTIKTYLKQARKNNMLMDAKSITAQQYINSALVRLNN